MESGLASQSHGLGGEDVAIDVAPVELRLMTLNPEDWRLCVAPMIDWTDRHCRFFHRLLAPRARLYSEMTTTGALLFGDKGRHLDFNAEEHPVALQLGGSEPEDLAACARLGEQWGYDEINLNCGCPSERVQKGAFGACLMAEPQLVADCFRAMQEAVRVPVTVKHRLGLDYDESPAMAEAFMGALYDAGCRVFIVHARNAVLKGLSPKDNRQIPPLRYAEVHRLKRLFPDALIVLNGGLTSVAQVDEAINPASGPALDGAMIGREAWHRPRVLSELSRHFWPDEAIADDETVLGIFEAYLMRQMAAGVPLRVLCRPLLGWPTGRRGVRLYRQWLSDNRRLDSSGPELLRQAWGLLGPLDSSRSVA